MPNQPPPSAPPRKYFVPELHEALWKNATTLSELVYKCVMEKKTETPEFQALLKFYGRDKLRKLYEEERERAKGRNL